LPQAKRCWSPLKRPDFTGDLWAEKAEGCYIYDEKGIKRIDAYSGLWNVNLGYGKKCIIDAVNSQLNTLPYVNPIRFTTEMIQNLSSLLHDITHDEIEKIIYTCSGSESIEVAIKLARKYAAISGRAGSLIGVISNSYHGNYYGSMSATSYDEAHKRDYAPFVDGFIKFSMPYCRCCETNNIKKDCRERMLDTLNSEFSEVKESLSAVIVETVLSSAGVIPVFEEYIKTLYKLCAENGVLFICDEVATGFYRTGALFSFQKYGIKPQIIALSKGVTNGYLPFGAVCVSRDICELFNQKNEIFYHLSTQNCNPVCAAASIATINELLKDDMAQRVKDLSDSFDLSLRNELSIFECVYEIRTAGLMFAVDIVDVKGAPIDENTLFRIVSKIYDLGCVVGFGFISGLTSSIILMPIYCTPPRESRMISRIIKNALYEYEIC